MPSEHLMEIVYELASLQSKNNPNSIRTLHPSSLLATSMAVQEYMINLMSPIVIDHINSCLDEEEEEKAKKEK